MRRRAFLGTAALAGVGGLAGCLGDSGGGTPVGTPSDETDGYPPASAVEGTPQERAVDTDAFPRNDVEGTQVPLAPVDVAHYWYQRQAARFADARGQDQYDRSHILGAVLSPAPDGGQRDPVGRWPTGDRIVCYCGCPHHLSSLRAATLIENGYEEVYVIDEGFRAWQDLDYPLAGENVTARPQLRVVEGRTAPDHAGGTAWATHGASGQMEAGPIADDGTFELHLRFADVSPGSVVTLRTPADTVEAPLGDLTDGVVTV